MLKLGNCGCKVCVCVCGGGGQNFVLNLRVLLVCYLALISKQNVSACYINIFKNETSSPVH